MQRYRYLLQRFKELLVSASETLKDMQAIVTSLTPGFASVELAR